MVNFFLKNDVKDELEPVNYYSEICLNSTFLGPAFVFEIDRCSIYTG